jgi:hypothetical protein
MNKKLLILGASVLVAGFFTLTAFDGKTLEQQKAEIAQTITMKLDELRMTKDQECSDKVNMEAQRRFDEIVAERAAEAAAKPGKKPTKKPTGSGSKGDPSPVKPTDPQKERPGAGGNKTPEEQKERGGAAKPGDVQQQKKRPGAAGGGGK